MSYLSSITIQNISFFFISLKYEKWQSFKETGLENVIYCKQTYNWVLYPSTYSSPISVNLCIRAFQCLKQCSKSPTTLPFWLLPLLQIESVLLQCNIHFWQQIEVIWSDLVNMEDARAQEFAYLARCSNAESINRSSTNSIISSLRFASAWVAILWIISDYFWNWKTWPALPSVLICLFAFFFHSWRCRGLPVHGLKLSFFL